MFKRKNKLLACLLTSALLLPNTMTVFANDISVEDDPVTGYTPAEFSVDADAIGGGIVVTIPAMLELAQNESGSFVASDVVSAYGNMNPCKLLSVSTKDKITYANRTDNEITATAAVTFGTDGVEEWTAEQTKNSITKLDSRKITVTVAQNDIEYIGDYASEVYFNIETVDIASFFNMSMQSTDVIVNGLADGVSRTNAILPSAYMGLSVTTIADNAFTDNTQIASVTIPKSINNIGNSAFKGCSNLKKVTYNGKEYNSSTSLLVDLEAAGVTIGTDAFANTGLLDDTALAAMFTWQTHDTYAAVDCLAENTTETTIIIPSTYNGLPVTQIGVHPFYSEGLKFSASNMTSLIMPDSITAMYTYVFEDCASLRSVRLSRGLTCINQGAFKGCTSLTSVEIPDGITSFCSETFQNCTSLSEVTYKGTTYTDKNELFAAFNANGVEIASYGVFDNTALSE